MKKPGPAKAMAELGKSHELYEVAPCVRTLGDGVVLEFDKHTDFVAMTPGGARSLANRLYDAARFIEKSEAAALINPAAKERNEWLRAAMELRRVRRYLNQKA